MEEQKQENKEKPTENKEKIETTKNESVINKEKTEKEKKEEKKSETEKEKKEEKKSETEKEKKEVGKKTAKKEEKKIKKTEAIARGVNMPISTIHATSICRFIKNKKIEKAIDLLEGVIRQKTAVPIRGEIPHRKGKLMSGRYPAKASKHFIKLLKSLAANASANGLDIEKVKVSGMANKASRPYKRFGSERFKRSHVTLRLK